ncbi:MAG: hypothetical protein ACOVP7_09035 [Lacibacter sp.]
MLRLLLLFLLILLIGVYLLRALLMASYENLNNKHERAKTDSLFNKWLLMIFSLKPLLQSKLRARSIDHKMHLRFQSRATVYYYVLWVDLFLLLILASNEYL